MCGRGCADLRWRGRHLLSGEMQVGEMLFSSHLPAWSEARLLFVSGFVLTLSVSRGVWEGTSPVAFLRARVFPKQGEAGAMGCGCPEGTHENAEGQEAQPFLWDALGYCG